LLAAAVLALYVFHLAGAWRWIYVVTAVASLYLNVFVGVVQAFQKLSFLQPLAPTQSEPPFIIAQLVVLLAFIALGALAVIRFRPAASASA
jgi:fatty acid desaturase